MVRQFNRNNPLSGAQLHRSWLELVKTEGPFLSVPVLKGLWPNGISPLGQTRQEKAELASLRNLRSRFEEAWDAWHRASASKGDGLAQGELIDYRAVRSRWVEAVVKGLWDWNDAAQAYPPNGSLIAVSPDGAMSVRPNIMLNVAGIPRAIVLVVDPQDAALDANYPADGWSASAIDRMAAMLRASRNMSIGVVTDGRWWALVSAPANGAVAWGMTDSLSWTEDSQVRDAFARLLDIRLLRKDVGISGCTLPGMFEDSVAQAEEITESLGSQIREAVDLLVSAFDENSFQARENGLPDPLPKDADEVYAAAVTMMMRVVFLLFAQERELLPLNGLFTQGYGLLGVLDDLKRRALAEGEESMDGTSLVWHRLLATSRAVYQGATFEDMRLPAYGGSVFDPAQHPFLTQATDHGELAVKVSDRVMLHVLKAVQEVSTKRDPEPRRLSFREVDVEQIGYIYEGLLGFTCRRAEDTVLGLMGKPGNEPEVKLAELEKLRAASGDDPNALTTALMAHFKKLEKDGSISKGAAPSKAMYAKAFKIVDEDEVELKLAQVTQDVEMRERLRPWIPVMRCDLRGKPVLHVPGSLYVASTSSRRDAGAHYTPRSLAEDVVKHALAPVVYNPGPAQTADESQWRRLSSREILNLKVADIACGSGAFLVAAARYLADELVTAWADEGALARLSPQEKHGLALRKVVANCLYGVDINPMAVEMCKISLWLVSLDRKLPFSFVDNKIFCGNALLGITDINQIKHLSLDGNVKSDGSVLFEFDVLGRVFQRGEGFDKTLGEALELRRDLAQDIDDKDPMRDAAFKTRQMRLYAEKVGRLRTLADGVTAAGLSVGGKTGKKLKEALDDLERAIAKAYPQPGITPDASQLAAFIERGLTPTAQTDYERWQCLHWPVEMPEVFERGGFDAIIGNPPFLGGQRITGSQGTNMRDWYTNVLANGKKGSADLCAYFFLRALSLLREEGSLGLLATNTIAQGATRGVGLDQMVERGFSIYRAIRSEKWPVSSASLEYAAVWGRKGKLGDAAELMCDGRKVTAISTLLEPQGRVSGKPVVLKENKGIAFQGCIVLGKGFVLEPDEAKAWIEMDEKNSEVLFPYLNGEDLNSRPDCSASRWVIDFNDWSEKKAADYELPFQCVVERVKPERLNNTVGGVAEASWWQFLRVRPTMRKAIMPLDELLVVALTSKTLMPMRLKNVSVFSHALVVFASDSYALQSVVSSSIHQQWGVQWGSGMKGDPRYTPSDVFETFPRPEDAPELDSIGRILDTERREIMLRRQLGLTALYNMVNDPDLPSEADADIARLRQIHQELDETVMAAYGWDDVPLNHGFYEYRKLTRWTVCPEARQEILDRLLEENHRRAALEAQGTALNSKKGA